MDNYIVRIYRKGKNKSRELVGMVEEVGVGGSKPFTNYDELWEILNQRADDLKRIKRKGKTGE